MFLAILLVAPAAPAPPMPVADWKPAIKSREFKFEEKNASAVNSVEAAKKAGLTADFQATPNGFGSGTFTFQKKDAPKITIHAHASTPVIVRGDVLYVADY